MVTDVDAGLGDPADPLSTAFRYAIDTALGRFLARQRPTLEALGPELQPVLDQAERSLSGGKRLRPGFCCWGYVAAAGRPAAPAALLDAAASLELLHVSALVHDDVMDGSDLRRGQPAVHRWFEGQHRDSGWGGDAEAFGRAGAILLGDLLLMWSTEMLRTAALDPPRHDAAQAIAELTRTEVTCGQYLDVATQARPWTDTDLDALLRDINRVVDYKSARYSVQRPLQLGAAIGGASAELLDSLAAFGSPLGRAFQFRDDLLGVFGDPAVTGKPAGDDLREGKRTVLVAHAYARAGATGRALLRDRLGDPALDEAGVASLQALITDVGARESVEAMITTAYEEAVVALARTEATPEGRTGLAALAALAVHRSA